MYSVEFTEIALKNLKRYPRTDQELILESIDELAADPLHKSNVKKLVNFGVSYRLRIGNYRVLFDREDVLKIIDIVDILDRKKAYRRRK